MFWHPIKILLAFLDSQISEFITPLIFKQKQSTYHYREQNKISNWANEYLATNLCKFKKTANISHRIEHTISNSSHIYFIGWQIKLSSQQQILIIIRSDTRWFENLFNFKETVVVRWLLISEERFMRIVSTLSYIIHLLGYFFFYPYFIFTYQFLVPCITFTVEVAHIYLRFNDPKLNWEIIN